MKTISRILIAFIFFASCKKDEFPTEISDSVVKKKFIASSSYADPMEFPDISEYYNADNFITKRELIFPSGEIRTEIYTYNDQLQLVTYEGNGSYVEYEYENNFLKKKVTRDDQLGSLQNYKEYEYSGSKLVKTGYFNRDSFQLSNSLYYYSANTLDSTYIYFRANTDSIEGKKIYQYDSNGHLTREYAWKWSHDDQNFYLVSTRFSEYQDNKLIRKEIRTEGNELFGFIDKFYYGEDGRLIKNEVYYEDIMLGYYDITYTTKNTEHNIPGI